MNLGHYSYLITVFVFAGSAVLIEWIVRYRVLITYKKFIGIMSFIFIPFTIVGELAATNWKAWLFTPDQNLGILLFGTTIESIIYGILITIAISSATLILSRYEEKKK